jgi:hypothetical protein
VASAASIWPAVGLSITVPFSSSSFMA